jgi:uncharacterized YigZ family protein
MSYYILHQKRKTRVQQTGGNPAGKFPARNEPIHPTSVSLAKAPYLVYSSRIVTHYPVPARENRVELTVVNSRFIATLRPVFSVEEAKVFIAHIKAEFADATHNVPAYLVGYGASVIAHCKDAGEPSGCAGRPILAVLRGSGLGDVAVVVTRYFGGTLLGTGGLVRAYSDAVRLVLESTPRAKRVLAHTVMLGFHYTFVDRIRRLVAAHHGHLMDESFGVEVTLTARFPVEHLPSFQQALNELTEGRVQVEVIKTDMILVALD